jgi:hypothetical protein
MVYWWPISSSLTLFAARGKPLKRKIDWEPTPIIVNRTFQTSSKHVNIELQGAAVPYEVKPFEKNRLMEE